MHEKSVSRFQKKYVCPVELKGVDINKEPESEKVLIRLTELNYAIAG